MEQKQIAKQMMEFNNMTFDNTLNVMMVLQDQTEKLVFSFLEKAQWLPEDGKKFINEWVKVYKKGREEFRSYVDDNHKKVNDYFAKAETEEVAKTGNK